MKKNILLYILITGLFLITFTSCFTGIESTKKINLSREDKKKSNLTEDQVFFSGIISLPLKDWHQGRIFLAADNRALLVFETLQSSIFADTTGIKGKTLEFQGVNSRVGADGLMSVILSFSDDDREYLYDTRKSFDDAMENFTTLDLPMLIDLEMVDQARELLKDKRLWTRSNLWYDENGQRIDGRKFCPVTVTDVMPGTMVFPVKLQLTDGDGRIFYMFMNFGIADTESRVFHNLFSLSDIRKQYPTVQPEMWDLISAGKICNGMTKLECRLALGNPVDVASGHDYSQTLDIWRYENGIILWFEDGKLVRHKG